MEIGNAGAPCTSPDLALLGHPEVNCPAGAREATLGCPQRGGLGLCAAERFLYCLRGKQVCRRVVGDAAPYIFPLLSERA